MFEFFFDLDIFGIFGILCLCVCVIGRVCVCVDFAMLTFRVNSRGTRI